ncbi:hypothetical protein ACFDR9_001280 [Janthinobacterium sp. CG_23.3]|uniref:hypothetical protein n=1 Tax=Janthinobacterium sp. CG_23.3 TaxID=3349634 RepID=UPI0038D39863
MRGRPCLVCDGGVIALRLPGLGRNTGARLLASVGVCLCCWYMVLNGHSAGPALLAPYFMLNAACCLERARVSLRGMAAAVLACVFFASAAAGLAWFPVIASVAISYCTLCIARHPD